MAVFQVLGCVIREPTLLENYNLTPEDFEGEDFHQIIFAAVYNLYNQGVKVIDCFAIDAFIQPYEKHYRIFSDNQGLEYINDAINMCEPENFPYNYNRVKKFSLLRFLEVKGLDTRGIFNPTEIDPTKQQEEQMKFDKYSIDQIIALVEDNLVIDAKHKFQFSLRNTGQLAGTGLIDLVESFMETPIIGLPMQSKIMNTLLRGSRNSTFYLRSGSTGSGKTRLAIADTCCAAVPWVYDLGKEKWNFTGFSTPALIITTELTIKEIQTIIIAYVSGVEEDHIIMNDYQEGEVDRLKQAANYILSSPLYIEYMPDFDIDDITSVIRRYNREKGIKVVNFDYLHTSMKLMAQISSAVKGMRVREDQVLFMFSDALKAVGNELDIHVDSATQLNGEYKDAREKDQTILRGSKAIADRIDAGYIALPPTKTELESIRPILSNGFYPTPNMIYHLYKCRRGKITRVKVWLNVNLGNCRIEDLFVTTFDNELIAVDKLTIESGIQLIQEHSVDQKEVEATPEEQTEAVKSFLSF